MENAKECLLCAKGMILNQECAWDVREVTSIMEGSALIQIARLNKEISASSANLILQFNLTVFVIFTTQIASNHQ